MLVEIGCSTNSSRWLSTIARVKCPCRSCLPSFPLHRENLMFFCQPLHPEIRDRFFALAVSCGIFKIFTLYFTSTLRCNDSTDLDYSKKRVFDNMTSLFV
jgi:hypothetical protein